jgi:hypothetical protein
LQKASEYHSRADECRALAARTAKPEHKIMLEGMAETWERLAQQREALIARRARIAAIEGTQESDGVQEKPRPREQERG